MKPTAAILIIALTCIGLLSSCRKDNYGPLGCPAPCDFYYTGIRPNDAPIIIGAKDSMPYYIVSSMTSRGTFYHYYESCDPGQSYFRDARAYIDSLPNNQPITYTTAISSFGWDMYNTLYLNDKPVYYETCPYFYCIMEPTKSISLSGPLAWVIEAQGVANDTIYYDTSNAPLVPTIVSDTIINLNAPYTLQGAGPISGDSVIFLIGDSSNTIRVTQPAGTLSYTFSATQMSTLKATSKANPGLIQIATYQKTLHTFVNGVRGHFYKEACFSQYVTLR